MVATSNSTPSVLYAIGLVMSRARMLSPMERAHLCDARDGARKRKNLLVAREDGAGADGLGGQAEVIHDAPLVRRDLAWRAALV